MLRSFDVERYRRSVIWNSYFLFTLFFLGICSLGEASIEVQQQEIERIKQQLSQYERLTLSPRQGDSKKVSLALYQSANSPRKLIIRGKQEDYGWLKAYYFSAGNVIAWFSDVNGRPNESIYFKGDEIVAWMGADDKLKEKTEEERQRKARSILQAAQRYLSQFRSPEDPWAWYHQKRDLINEQSKKKKYREIKKEFPTENENQRLLIKGYLQNLRLQKLLRLDAVEGENKAITLFYWHEGRLFYVYALYQGQRGGDGTWRNEENRYYFRRGKLVKWILPSGREASPSSTSFQERGKQIEGYAAQYAQEIYDRVGWR